MRNHFHIPYSTRCIYIRRKPHTGIGKIANKSAFKRYTFNQITAIAQIDFFIFIIIFIAVFIKSTIFQIERFSVRQISFIRNHAVLIRRKRNCVCTIFINRLNLIFVKPAERLPFFNGNILSYRRKMFSHKRHIIHRTGLI